MTTNYFKIVIGWRKEELYFFDSRNEGSTRMAYFRAKMRADFTEGRLSKWCAIPFNGPWNDMGPTGPMVPTIGEIYGPEAS